MNKELKEKLGKLKQDYDALHDEAIEIIRDFMRNGTGKVCVFEYGSTVTSIADGGGEFEVISLWLNPDNEVEYHTDMDAENNYTDCAGVITELTTDALLTIVMHNIDFGLYTFTNESFVGEPEDLYDL